MISNGVLNATEMTSRTVRTKNDREINLSCCGRLVSMTLNRGSPEVVAVTVDWMATSAEEAVKFVQEATIKDITQQGRFLFCADFTKQLTEALSNANTKKTTEPTHRTHGSATYGRHALRNAASSRVYPSR